MSEMIERVAIALCNTRRSRHDIPTISSLDVLIPEARTDYRNDARTVIEVIREPTERMQRAFNAMLNIHPDDRDTCRSVLGRMIDAALAEPKA